MKVCAMFYSVSQPVIGYISFEKKEPWQSNFTFLNMIYEQQIYTNNNNHDNINKNWNNNNIINSDFGNEYCQ